MYNLFADERKYFVLVALFTFTSSQYFTVIIIEIVSIVIDCITIIPLSLATLLAIIRLASDLVYRSIH